MADRRRLMIDRSHQADLGIAIMARNAEDTLPNLLKSIRPFVKQIVVGVDETTTDRTAAVAKKNGADKVFPLHVSDWHECVAHERQLAQHFANARQETFKHLDTSLAFWGWLDADDVLAGGEILKQALDELPEDQIGMWLPYEYAAITRADGQRRVNTLFHRERFLRTVYKGQRVNWTWEGRVHETVKPDVPASWALNEQIVVIHQPGAHQTNQSAPRNLLLLEMDYEEDQRNPRTLFYLGNQHFALGNWPAAINWYELLCSGIGENPYELWQANLYASLAYENLGDLDNANRAAYAALDVVPIHGEPYFRIASIANLCGDYEKAVWWNQQGRKMVEAPFFAFKNPLDYTFNQRVIQGEALMNLGRITEAQQEWMEAAKVFVDEKLASALQSVDVKIKDMEAADAFVTLAERLPDEDYRGEAWPVSDRINLYSKLAPDIRAFGRTRDLVMPSVMRGRANSTQPRIVFWCGRAAEPWGPPSLNTTGIGGSETAVIEIACRFARDGWLVDVYNEAERYEGVYDGVGYWDLKRWTSDEKADVFVSWRNPAAWELAREAERAVLWCHDLNYGPDTDKNFWRWNRVLGVSQWHRGMLGRYYGTPATSDDYFSFVPNGIDLSRFAERPEKVPYRCVYASSPDRGLVHLLKLWPEILKAEPEAHLHVAYGWETMDRMISNGRDDLARFKESVVRLIERTPNVVWRGRLPQDELARLYGESVVWTYPTDFLEVSCISAMEAMAGGAIPVTTAAGALPETVGDAGFLVPGPVQSRGYQDTYPRAVLGALSEWNVKLTYAEQARRHASGLSWDAAYDRWKQVLGLEDRSNGHETMGTDALTKAAVLV